MSNFNKRYLEFCKPFIASIKGVYSTMLNNELTHGRPEIKKHNMTYGEYSALMGINGVFDSEGKTKKFKGNLIISWGMDSYLKVASEMLMEEYEAFSEEIEDVGLEICNIVMGNAKKELSNQGYKIEMSTPTLIMGKDVELKTEKNVIAIITPMESAIGSVHVELNYEDFE